MLNLYYSFTAVKSPFNFICFFRYILSLVLCWITYKPILAWLFMEISMFILLGFGLSLISHYSKISLYTYYLFQSVLSLLLLLTIIMLNTKNLEFWCVFLIPLIIIIKLGVWPLNHWYLTCIFSQPRILFVIMLTLHKLPIFNIFIIYRNYIRTSLRLGVLLIFIFILVLNLFISSLIILSSSELKSLVLYSSLGSSSWILISLSSSEFVFWGFYFFYRLLIFLLVVNINLITLNLRLHNYIMTIYLFAMAGLPPLPLFFIKLIIIWSVYQVAPLGLYLPLFLIIVALSSLLAAFRYLRLAFLSTINRYDYYFHYLA
jgi:NADH:ubiquinone oxidoreductase subunit 2 (subunit N)